MKTKSQKREMLYETILRDMRSTGQTMRAKVLSEDDSAQARLKDYLNTPESLELYETSIREACKDIFFHFLVAVDEQTIGFPLAFVDWDTKENLEPKQELWHDAFSFYVYEREHQAEKG